MPVRRIVLELPAQVQAPVVAAPSGEKGITPLAAAAAVWLAGCVLYLVFSAGSYLVYRRKLLKCTHVCGCGIAGRAETIKGRASRQKTASCYAV